MLGPDRIREYRNWRQPLWVLSLVIFVVYSVGVVGYMIIEGWSLFDAIYMTGITLTTVGYGEVKPLSPAGRLFTLMLIMIGVLGVAYGFSVISQMLFETSLARLSRDTRMEREIEKLKGHFIICGYGRVGQEAVQHILDDQAIPLVIDVDEGRMSDLNAKTGAYYILGDATEDDVLIKAGVKRAKGILVCTGDDADNLFVVLSARTLNPDLLIIARASHAPSQSKMTRAGADRVVSPYVIGGHRMANYATRPELTSMLDVITTNSGLELFMEDLRVQEGSLLVGKSLREAHVRHQTGVNVVAIHRDGQDVISPGGDHEIQVDDHLIVVGTREQVNRLEVMALSAKR